MTDDLRQTPLFDFHVAAGGRIVPFAGYRMPVQFEGIKAEHAAVRTRAGLFDVSHMGEVWVEGPGALAYVDWLITNDAAALADGQILYTPLCNAKGTIVDDCLIYRVSQTRFLAVVNASNHDKDLLHFQNHAPKEGVSVVDRSYETGQVALQGPRAVDVMAAAGGQAFVGLESFRFVEGNLLGGPCLVSRTGYTGEDGFEIYAPNDHIRRVWEGLMAAGKPLGIAPIGLGARDTLRLEAKLCLYGNDIDETTTPLEAGLAWTVKLDKSDFLGKNVLVQQKTEGVSRKLAGFRMTGKGIARHGYPVVASGAAPSDPPIGHVASGSPSPTLDINIGLAYVPAKGFKVGQPLGIVIRDKVVEAEIIKTPFYKRP